MGRDMDAVKAGAGGACRWPAGWSSFLQWWESGLDRVRRMVEGLQSGRKQGGTRWPGKQSLMVKYPCIRHIIGAPMLGKVLRAGKPGVTSCGP